MINYPLFRSTTCRRSGGFGLVEVVIGAAIIAVFLTAAVNVLMVSRRLEGELIKKLEAQYLAEEGIEVVRLLRDTGWTASITPLALGTAYYLDFDGLAWRATTAPKLINSRFTRTVVLEAGYRDSNHDIVDSGINDDNLRRVTVAVAWPGRSGTTTFSLATYLTNLFGN